MRHEHWEQRLVHYQYIEEKLDGLRVLEVGCGTGAGADYLAQRCAQVVCVDTSSADLERCERAYPRPNLSFRQADPARLQFDDVAFDLVVVPELNRWITWGAFIPEVRRVLAVDGAALFMVPSGDLSGNDGICYGDLEEHLSHTFPHVRLMGQMAFSGVTLADFAPDGEVEPLLDCSLVPEDDPPSSYLALCSGRPLRSLGYCVLQVPSDDQDAGQELQQVRRDLRRLREENRRLELQRGRGGQGHEPVRDSEQPRDQRLASMEQRLDRAASRADDLDLRLQAERDRLDRERDRAEEAGRLYLEERGRAEAEYVRAEAAERALEECRGSGTQQGKRAEAAERRCDSLLSRIEQGAADLSRLHQRIAELQGLRQADQWRIDELMGRVREQEERLLRAGAPGPADTEPAEPVSDDPAAELLLSRQRVAELEQQISQLKNTEDSALAALQQRLREAKERARQAEKTVADARERQEQAEERAREAGAQAAQLVRRADQASQEHARLETELMKSESRVEEFKRKGTNAEAKVVQLEVQLNRYKAEAKTLSKWAEELRDDLAEAKGKSRAVPTTPEPEVTALRRDLRQAVERGAELEQRCDRFMQQAEQAQAELRDREQTLKEAMAAADGSVVQELQQLRQQAAEAETLRQRLQQTEQELEQVAGELRDNEQAQLELQSVRQELEQALGQQQQLDQVHEELEQLRLQAIQHQETKQELQDAAAELKATHVELRAARRELERLPPAAEEAKSAWAEAPTEVGPSITAQQAELMEMRDRQLDALLEGADLHRQESERSQARLRELEQASLEQRQQRDQLQRQLNECVARRGELEQGRDQLQQQARRLARDLARAQGELQRCQEARQAAAAQPAEAPAERQELDQTQRQLDDLDQQAEQLAAASDRAAEIDTELARQVERMADLESALSGLGATDDVPDDEDPQ